MFNKKLLTTTVFSTAISAVLISTTAIAEVDHSHHQDGYQHHNHGSQPNDHAPITVMGDHRHPEGGLMLSYRYSRMLMKGMKDGDSSITPSEIVSAGGSYGYMMTPTRMTMDMHMIGAMYAPSNDITLMLMGHYMDKNMDMVNRANVTSKMDSSGFGDTSISALYNLFNEKGEGGDTSRLHANIGLSLPTGSTDKKGLRMGSYGNLPYSMQLGSGTFDPQLGLTYIVKNSDYSWGTQAKATFRMGKNDEGYRLGNEYKATAYAAKNLNDWLSASIKLEGTSKGEISGSDTSISSTLVSRVPTFDPSNYGGETIELGFGLNLIEGEGKFKNHRLAFEYTTPIYEDLNGPQMSTQHSFWLGWQYSF